jgi:gliding motility associated protien GldN
MKRAALFLVGAFILVQGMWSQNSVTQSTQPASPNPQLTLDTLKTVDVYEKIHIAAKKPIPYVPIREADVMWSKDIWRIIDLREKMNQPLYYPTTPIGKRMSFFSLVMFGLSERNLHAFSNDKNNLFSSKTMLGYKEIVETLGADSSFDKNGNLMNVTLKTALVKRLLIKEKWYFDKQHSTMKVQIVGIAPIKLYNKELKDANGNITLSPEVTSQVLFWIYFPEFRELFAQYEIFNRFSDAQNISFDDLFMQRRFASYIFGESNVYDNRFIGDFLLGDDILFEAEKIKTSLMEMEHDLWEY